MKTPETDNHVVDYLYDDLPDAQAEAFSARLETDEAAATEARSFATILKLYRAESEELTPSVAATERLLRAAERSHRSLWARLFGALPQVVLRPAVSFAVVAALIIGGGVFYVLSQASDPRSPEPAAGGASKSTSRVERTVSAAPAATPTADKSVAENAVSEPAGGTGGASKRGPADGDVEQATGEGRANREARVSSSTVTRGSGYFYKKSKQGALAARDESRQDADRGLRGRLARRPARKKAHFSVAEGAPKKAAAPNASPARPAPPQAADSLRQAQNKPVGSSAVDSKEKTKDNRKLSPPALHNRARKKLAKGQVALACQMFGTLVRGYRGYVHRADALLGWARCEMARGSYNRASQLIRQLISEYPAWKKEGTRMLAQIQRRQTQAALRAQRVRRVRRRPAPRPAPARRSRQSPSSTRR